jgi:hypothetical protein
VLEPVTPRDAGGSALEAFDGEGVHVRSIGGAKGLRFPCSGDRRKGRARMDATLLPRKG